MPRIEAIYYAPVKSLALAPLERARAEKPGIAGDRAFFIIDAQGRLFTQRQHFPLVQVKATYDVTADRLALTFPDGSRAEGVPAAGERVTVSFFATREVEGAVAKGPWAAALSAFAGQPLRLVRTAPGQAFDGYPLSMCSHESVNALAAAAGAGLVDGRRFRQNLYISGAAAPHEEDAWIGRQVRVGSAVLNIRRKDSRCVITTRDPDTGEHDLDTLKILAGYRGVEDDDVNFGVYCTVAEPGAFAVGDEVAPL